MSKKNLLIISIISLVTLFLIYFAVKVDKNNHPTSTKTTPTEHIAQKTTTISFSPARITLSPNNTKPLTVTLMADSGNSLITGTQVELLYNPSVISNITVKAPTQNSLFGDAANQLVLFNKTDTTQGLITYAIAIPTQGHAVKGKGAIGTLTFTARSIDNSTTQINFATHTVVTQSNETQSVLKTVIPLSIRFSSLAPTITSAPLQ